MSATYGHNIVSSEAFSASRHGARLASQRPRQRIEVPPAKADRIMLYLSIGAGAIVFLYAMGGGAG